jgi:peptide/nickel transport system substrate-binding protein
MNDSRLQRHRPSWPFLVLVLGIFLLWGSGPRAQVQQPAENPDESVPQEPPPPPPPPPPPTAGETLRVGFGIQPDQLEPSQVTNAAVASLLEHVVETLVTVDESGAVVPHLAESWEISADGRQYTFNLPTGVTFQDGTALNAEAVVWNFERMEQIVAVVDCPVVAVELAALQSVQATDDDSVQINLSEPLPNFLGSLSWIAWGILSPLSVNLPDNELINIQHPVGTGPYLFEALTESQMRLKRFDGYRGQQPYYSQLTVEFIGDAQSRGQRLLDGDLDVALFPTSSQIGSFNRNADYEVQMSTSARTIFVALNNQKPPFDDVRVRQAVNYAIDKSTIVTSVLQGAATVSDAPVAPSVLGYCPSEPYGYDPAKATALLEEAAVPDGTSLALLTPQGRYFEDEQVANKIAQYLRAVGFEVTVTPVSWPAFMATFYGAPDQLPEMHLFGWAPTFLDAGQQLPQLFNSTMWPPLGPSSSFYKNQPVEELLATASKSVDPTTRAELFCQASRQIWSDAPVIFLWAQKFPVAYKTGLADIVTLPNEKISLAFTRPASVPPSVHR